MSKIQKKLIEIGKGIHFGHETTFKTMQKLYRESAGITDLMQVFGKYIGEGCIVHFPSPRGVGKTFFLLQLCLAISSKEKSFLGETIELSGNTIYVNLELNENTMKRRLKTLMSTPPFKIGDDFHSFVVTTRNPLLEELSQIAAEIEKYKPVLVVIDNLRMAFVGSDVNNGTEMTKLMFSLIALRDTFGCAIVITDHFRKHTSNKLTDSDLQSGSGVKTDLSDGDMFLRKSCQNITQRILKRCKSRSFEESDAVKLIELCPETLWFKLIADDVNEAEHIGIKDLSDKKEQIDIAKSMREKGMSYEEIGRNLGKSKSTICRWFKVTEE